jgi:competence ComEA-like helix-hairpin-helix protein
MKLRGTSNNEHRTSNIELTTLAPRPGHSSFVIRHSTRASVLVGLLWCLALLSVVVIGFLHTTRLDLQVGKNYGDRIQAHYLALAGIEKTKALLYHDARERSRSKQNHAGKLYNAPDDFRDVTLGRGRFKVFRRGRDDEGGEVIYGVSDEESRLNLNSISTEQLGKLDRISADVIAAIVDWRDGDNTASPNGAEVEYYSSLQPPYQPRNGPFQTIRELLMVRGVTSQLLFGNDSRFNDLLDIADESGPADTFVNQTASDADRGWAARLTVNSSVRNVNAAGEDRVNVQSADESALRGVSGITPDIARAIVSYRGQNQLRSIADLLDVTAPQNQNQLGSTNSNNSGGSQTTQSSGSTANTSGRSTSGSTGGSSSSSGRRVISEDLLVDIGDEVTADSNQDQSGAVNVNTASLEVLACLPGIDRELAQAIISRRQSSGYFANTAGLLRVPGMTRDIFKQVAPLVTARSETFRILSEGKVTSTGVRQRIEVVVHVGLSSLQTLSYREDDL